MPGRKESLAVPTRDLPCAKGAVGQRRLRDWQRAGGEPPALSQSSRAGHVIKLSGFVWPYNPPCMALPCCPPFAQGGLFFAQANTTGLDE